MPEWILNAYFVIGLVSGVAFLIYGGEWQMRYAIGGAFLMSVIWPLMLVATCFAMLMAVRDRKRSE